MTSPTTSPEYTRLGSGKKLSLIDAAAQSVGFMGPVFSIAFLVPLLVGLNASGNGAGVAAPLAVLLAAVGVLGLGWIVAEYARRIHAAGSLYDYVTDGLGVRVGAAAGYLYYVGVLALGAGLLVMIGGTIHDTLDAEFGTTLLPTPGWDVLLVAALAVVLFLGVALSTRAQLVLALVSLATVLTFSIVVIAKVGSGNDVVKAFNPQSSPQHLPGVLFGVLYGVLLFTGFETAANLGEETEHPRRDIPRAVLISVLSIAGFYVVASYAQVAGFHFNLDTFAKNAGAPLFGLAGPVSDGGYASVAVRRLVETVVVLDMIAVLIGVSVSASRGFFALARDRRLPARLAAVSRRGTPLPASIVVLLAYAAVMVVTLTWTSLFALPDLPHYVSMFSWLSTFGSFSLAIIYLLMSVGAIKGLADHPKRWAVYLASLVGVMVTGAALFGSVYKVSAPTSYAPWASLLVLAVGAVLALTVPGRPSAGQHFVDLRETERGPVKL